MVASADILLATLNAKYIHCAFGLRYLFANLGELQPRTALLEFELQQRPLDIVEQLLARRPRIIGLGVYIWNVRETTEVVGLLKRIAPEVIVILGGPEVSYEWEDQEIVRLADHVITGEADLMFAEVCGRLLSDRTTAFPPARNPDPDPALSPPSHEAGAGLGSGLRAGEDCTPLPKIIPAELPKLEQVTLPYDLYTPHDLAHRVIYVEASRGCPFTCEFCLSSLDIPVRQFPLDPFLSAMDRLLSRGATQFKFVDRTFNLNLMVSRAILQFFLARMRDGLFVHFEMVPDRLPEPLREVIAQFPPGSLQFEVGVQTFDDQTSRNISRRQDCAKLAENLAWLRSRTGVHVHADLIAGLPGEGLASFAAGFDRLVALGPQEIQVGILKRLRGTPIVRHDAGHAMRYSPQPPYELLNNRDLDFPTMQRLRRFARYWDLVANSGNFRTTTPLLWTSPVGRDSVEPHLERSEASAASPSPPSRERAGVRGRTVHLPEEAPSPCAAPSPHPQSLSPGGGEGSPNSPFWRFLAFSDWLFTRLGKRHAIALDTLAESLFTYLTNEAALSCEQAATALWTDYQGNGRRDRPPFLAPFLPPDPPRAIKPKAHGAPKRQARHLETERAVRPAA